MREDERTDKNIRVDRIEETGKAKREMIAKNRDDASREHTGEKIT